MDYSKSAPIEYERFVKDILSSRLANVIPGARSAITHNRLLLGRSGHEHQFDIFADLNVGDIAFRVAVECKCYSKRVGVDEILEFSARLQDVAVHKGIVVTTVGFQEGALSVAKSTGIALVRVGKLAVKASPSAWVTVLSTPVLTTSTAGERLVDWLVGPGIAPDSLAKEGRFFEDLNLGHQGALSSEPSGTFFRGSDDDWLVAYALMGVDDFIVDRDGLFAAMTLFRRDQQQE